MELIARKLGSNTYGDGNLRRCVLGGIPNVPIDIHNNLAPLDNRPVIKSHPNVKYLLKRGPFEIGFHKKSTNKYLVAIKLRTGETLVKSAINAPPCTPTINADERTIRWTYPNGCWIEECATERQIKEKVFQKAGQVINFNYKTKGLRAEKNGNKFEFYRMKNNKLAFSIQRPYYCTAEGEFLSYVPVQWLSGDVEGGESERESEGETDGNGRKNWAVIYPAPEQGTVMWTL